MNTQPTTCSYNTCTRGVISGQQYCYRHWKSQPKPTGDYRPQDLDDGDTGVARSEENYDPQPKPRKEDAASPTGDFGTKRTAECFDAKWMPEPNSGCWLWTANIGANGYGQIQIKDKPVPAHRAAWELFKGSIPKGIEVCHRCDTPTCVNPDHLFLATHAENIMDSHSKGRSKPQGVATTKELRWTKKNRQGRFTK